MKVKDITTGKIETVIERTSNWFTQQDFEKRFKIIE